MQGKEIIEKYNQARQTENEIALMQKQKLRRQITDYMCKYANYDQLIFIAVYLGIKEN